MQSCSVQDAHWPQVSAPTGSLLMNLTENPDLSPALPRTSVDAHEVLGRVVKECHRRIGSKGLRVALRLLSRQYHIIDDGERLRQVYLNLLNNAVAAARPGSTITLRATCPSDCALRIEVEERSPWRGRTKIAEPVPAAKARAVRVRGRR
jgi:C4-dicarboxylate-specific signal transduction histidine kinase